MNTMSEKLETLSEALFIVGGTCIWLWFAC